MCDEDDEKKPDPRCRANQHKKSELDEDDNELECMKKKKQVRKEDLIDPRAKSECEDNWRKKFAALKKIEVIQKPTKMQRRCHKMTYDPLAPPSPKIKEPEWMKTLNFGKRQAEIGKSYGLTLGLYGAALLATAVYFITNMTPISGYKRKDV